MRHIQKTENLVCTVAETCSLANFKATDVSKIRCTESRRFSPTTSLRQVSFRNQRTVIGCDYVRGIFRQANGTSCQTPWSTVLLEKLTGSQLVKKFPAFHGIRKFITAFITARHLSLSWASSIHSIPPHPTFWRSELILSSQVVSFPQVSPPKPVNASPLTHTRYMPRPSHSSRFYHSNNIGLGEQFIKFLIM